MSDMTQYAVIQGTLTDGYHVYLCVGAQEFRVTPVPYEERSEAQWMREQLEVALERIVKERRDDPIW